MVVASEVVAAEGAEALNEGPSSSSTGIYDFFLTARAAFTGTGTDFSPTLAPKPNLVKIGRKMPKPFETHFMLFLVNFSKMGEANLYNVIIDFN